jgi:arsenite oxidase small subunit
LRRSSPVTLAMKDPMPNQDKQPAPGAITRREFVKIGGATVSGALACGMVPALANAPAAKKNESYPVLDVARITALKVDEPVTFAYPDENSPAILVRLRDRAPGGVGPGETVVAFSMLCTHKGCPVSYRRDRKLLICPCHWSSFDPAKAGQMVIGQGSQSLPQITLRVAGDSVQAVGIEGLVYGRHTNIL